MMFRLLHNISLILAFIPAILYSQSSIENYSASSVLSSGKWLKIAVTADGIYKISYSQLKEAGLSDPSGPRLFASNWGQLSYLTGDPAPDDLREISVLLSTGSDGIFGEGDYLLFYGQATHRWKYNEGEGRYDFVRHNYSDTAFYFITSGGGAARTISAAAVHTEEPDYYSSESDLLFIHELETENIIKSGREWYQPVSSLTPVEIRPEFTDLVSTGEIRYRIRVLARAPSVSQFSFSEGESLLNTILVQDVNMYNYTGTYARISDSSGTVLPLSATPVYRIGFRNEKDPGARGWLDFVTLHARKHNVYRGKTLHVLDSRTVSAGNLTEYSVNSPGRNPLVWDITDAGNPKNVNPARSGENIVFRANSDSLRKFVIFSESDALKPVFRPGPVANQDLHASPPAEMVIVTHPLFRKYAKKLADLHFEREGLVSQIVTPGEIYNEFSGGIPDIAAIRNFLRMKYLRQKNTATPLRYLLLFGDGSYENKTPPPNSPNYIPTYQSQNSNIIVSSFTSDDFYGLLEDGKGEAEGTEDIGIGRIPVTDTLQAGIVVNKIRRYLESSNTGEWKNIVCMVADDEDGNAHMADAEGLSLLLQDSIPEINVDKIYLDAFRQETSAAGQSYPDVTIAINNRINSGCLIFNYVGHGNENGLAHERVVKTEDINSWKNGTKLPLFITATCEFSRFDDADINMATKIISPRTSAGEKVLLNPGGGAIALMSTTRVAYSAPNYYLNRNIYDAIIRLRESGEPLALGDIMRIAKNNSGDGPNKRNFSLLGDPAVILAFPPHGKVITDSINHGPAGSAADTLKALSTITISGHIEDHGGALIDDFNGTVSQVIYDKPAIIRTLANDGGPPMTFEMRNNILFSGKTKAANGRFSFTFMVPRDINYSFGTGKISYYAKDETRDMNGSYSGIIVGGFENTAASDTAGPLIKLYLNDTLFRSGGISCPNPRILAIIEDEGGINTTGAGIGHDITAYLDNDPASAIILNNYFESDFNSHTRGRISYALSDLPEGNHTLTLKAWDNFNNSSSKTIRFTVTPEEKFMLRDIVVYPNPVAGDARISANHNRPDRRLEITISIIDVSGRTIRIIKEETWSGGYRLSPLLWDGNTDGGERAGKGIYFCRLTVRTDDGEEASGTVRIIIL